MATIIYDLECEYAHRFEGWFRSVDDFDQQREKGLLQCPQCATHAVKKIPSKLNIGSTASKPTEHAESEHTPAKISSPSPAHPTVDVATAFVMAKQAIQALIAHSEDVGGQFAEEARKIHYNEAPLRAIRGQASAEEFEELRDEGIDIIALPHIPQDDELN